MLSLCESPKLMPESPDIGYWLDTSRLGEKPFATLRFTDKLLDRPLLRSELRQDLMLRSPTVLRQPNSTNFRVTAAEWQRVYELRVVRRGSASAADHGDYGSC